MRDKSGKKLIPMWLCNYQYGDETGSVIVAAWCRDECYTMFGYYTSFIGIEPVIKRLKKCAASGEPRIFKETFTRFKSCPEP